MGYVYILTTKVVEKDQRSIDGFIIQGVYSNYEVCEQEMLKHFELMSHHYGVHETGIQTGLACSQGLTKSPFIEWNDGKTTVYTIQERILDQIIFADSVKEEP